MHWTHPVSACTPTYSMGCFPTGALTQPCQHRDIPTNPLIFFLTTHSHNQLFLTLARLRHQDRHLKSTRRSPHHLRVKRRAVSPSGHALQVSFWTPRTATSSARTGLCLPRRRTRRTLAGQPRAGQAVEAQGSGGQRPRPARGALPSPRLLPAPQGALPGPGPAPPEGRSERGIPSPRPRILP